MKHGFPADDEPFFRRSTEDFSQPASRGRWVRVVDWLGARRPLTLIALACGIIAIIRYGAHLVG